jgi:hypothetical protein
MESATPMKRGSSAPKAGAKLKAKTATQEEAAARKGSGKRGKKEEYSAPIPRAWQVFAKMLRNQQEDKQRFPTNAEIGRALRVTHSPELEGAILRWAGDVEVVSPGKLRERMRFLRGGACAGASRGGSGWQDAMSEWRAGSFARPSTLTLVLGSRLEGPSRCHSAQHPTSNIALRSTLRRAGKVQSAALSPCGRLNIQMECLRLRRKGKSFFGAGVGSLWHQDEAEGAGGVFVEAVEADDDAAVSTEVDRVALSFGAIPFRLEILLGIEPAGGGIQFHEDDLQPGDALVEVKV